MSRRASSGTLRGRVYLTDRLSSILEAADRNRVRSGA